MIPWIQQYTYLTRHISLVGRCSHQVVLLGVEELGWELEGMEEEAFE